MSTTIPPGSWILITGATGFVATQITQALLTRGYKVRGTVRDAAKASWLITDLFRAAHAAGTYELVVVPTLADAHAFDEAIRGVSAVAHVASVVTLDANPERVIPQTVLGVTALLEAASREVSVKEFVYTSSIVAATMPVAGNQTLVGSETFNELALRLAWEGRREEVNGFLVYMASKAAAEKAVWEFVRDKKPRFTVNSVVPGTIIGAPMHRAQVASDGQWMRHVYEGNAGFLLACPESYTVDVKDVALLHVAAILDPDTKNARLQAWADNTNWNAILAIMRRQFPDDKWSEDIEGVGQDKLSITTDFSQQLALLKKWAGQEGWVPLERTVEESIRVIKEFSA
ncbi:NAD(P)-binding protein [Echria macrotheca]|uniref:NAD(P)-binding protein n=1 Tax=Echria macrotheca TaxID=438768 RepID=A0AAJ0BCG6_9PEZI|nr:NAD(P)-binding protein [Echria macrotheca]